MPLVSGRVVILHGCGGTPEGNWFPWLKQELAARNIDCQIPALPPPEQQSLASWLAAYRQQSSALHSDDILIGHSIGCALALRLLEQQAVSIKACILVCPFVSDLDNDFDIYNRSFYATTLDWNKIKTAAQTFMVYAGQNDPYVSNAHAVEVADRLGVPVHWIAQGGHLNAESGYTKFPDLLSRILT